MSNAGMDGLSPDEIEHVQWFEKLKKQAASSGELSHVDGSPHVWGEVYIDWQCTVCGVRQTIKVPGPNDNTGSG